MALHIAGLADGLVILHDICLSGQDAITVKAAEVFQVPVLSLRLCVLITEDQLITASTARLLAISVVAPAEKLVFLPEVDHIH